MQQLAAGVSLPDGSVLVEGPSPVRGGRIAKAKHPEVGPVEVLFLDEELQAVFPNAGGCLAALSRVRSGRVQALLGAGEFEGARYMVYQALKVRALPAWLGMNRPDEGLSDEQILHLATELSEALADVHKFGSIGFLRMSDVGFNDANECVLRYPGLALLQWLSGMADEGLEVAPEMLASTRRPNSTEADVFALGTILMMATSPEPLTPQMRDFAFDLWSQEAPQWMPDALRSLVAESEMVRPMASRISGLFREALEGPAAAEGPLFDDDELPPAPAAFQASEATERWILHIDGRDLGPYSFSRVCEMLDAEEIREDVVAIDSFSGQRKALAEHAEFDDFLLEFIPIRAEREAERIERTERIKDEASRGAKMVLIFGVPAAIAAAVLLVMLRVEPQPLGLEGLVGDFPYLVEAPEPDYQEIAADSQMLANLFNPPPPEERRRRRSRSRDSGGEGGGDYYAEDNEIYTLDLDSSAPSRKLTSEEINSTISANLHRISPCFEDEMERNASFSGANVSWSIRPEGRVFNVQISSSSSGSELDSCLQRGFRRMRFPQFNDVPMSVSLPFNLR